MPGMGHKMPKDKMYQDGKKKTSYDENITKTMAQGRSGIYMDRDADGKLPMDRVKLHYDRTGAMQDAKLEQLKEIKQGLKNVKAGFEYGGKQFMDEAKDIYKSVKSGTKTAYDAAKQGAKSVGDAVTSVVRKIEGAAQPTSNIKKRGSNSIYYQDRKDKK